MACAANECPVVIASAPPAMPPLSYAIGADEIESISVAERTRRTSALAQWYRAQADWPVLAQRIAALFQ